MLNTASEEDSSLSVIDEDSKDVKLYVSKVKLKFI